MRQFIYGRINPSAGLTRSFNLIYNRLTLNVIFQSNPQYPPALYNQMLNVVFVNYEHLTLNQKGEPPLRPKVVTKGS